jgi:hypothetical protein
MDARILCRIETAIGSATVTSTHMHGDSIPAVDESAIERWLSHI